MIRLRPITAADVPTLERQYAGPEESGGESWFGFREPGTLARLVAAQDTLREDRGKLAVVAADDPAVGDEAVGDEAIGDEAGGDEVVGEVGWVRMMNGPSPNGYCWNVGIWVVPEHRGKGYGSDAQRLVAAYLFEHTYLERVEAGTESDNVAEQRALEKAGFTREGVLRRSCFRGGQWRDMVVYSKLRGEP